MALPLPDDAAGAAARDRLASIDIGISAPTLAGLGMLAEPVVFVASVQGSAYPRPILSTRVVLLTGSHAGGVVAGPTPDPRNSLPLQHLAVNAGAGMVTLEWQPASAPIELEDAITPEQMDAALRSGWAEAERAADEGIELLVLAAGGAGATTAAAAVVAAITGAEPTALLGRVVTPAGYYDDNAWMTRCLALRDALHRVRARDGDPRNVLAALGGADIAAATGLLLGAASRRTPLMIDGPVGAAAALLANDFAPQSRRWVMLPDTGRHPAVRMAAESLELRPWLDLCLDLGEGATSLAALPLLQTALTLSGVGEPVEATPLTRYDSTGNQVFVGVAKPVEPAISDTEDADAAASAAPSPASGTDTPTQKVGSAEPAAATADDDAARPDTAATEPSGAGQPGKPASKAPMGKAAGKPVPAKTPTKPAGKAVPAKGSLPRPGPGKESAAGKDGAGKDAARTPAQAAKDADGKDVAGKGAPPAKDTDAKDPADKDATGKGAPPAKDPDAKDPADKDATGRGAPPAKDTDAKDPADTGAAGKAAPPAKDA
ncbi:MAG TPA: nicotinate-nucleotide--dimethylbenzimidazole phosphoribosyltransferase, partial [Micromonosporaceae bacterium]